MAATDYVFVKGFVNVYLAHKKKPGSRTMSLDRREITDGEMIGLFEFYLRNWCDDHPGEDTVVISDERGKDIFKATLLDKEN